MTNDSATLDDEIRAEKLAHVASCSQRPRRDSGPPRSAPFHGAHGRHVCEHIARDIEARRYFEWDTAEDLGAIDEFRVVCPTCSSVAGDGPAPGERWLACYECQQEFGLRPGWPEFARLAPRQYESFAPWWQRVGDSFVSVPVEIADQWLHRHWGHSSYEWLPLLSLRFAKEEWALAESLGVIAGERAYPRRDHRGNVPLEIHDTWLGRTMLRTGTWPTPIVVLDNSRGRFHDLHRLQLIEGHTRLGYLRTLAVKGTAHTVHDVWIARHHGDT